VAGNYAYVADGEYGLAIIQIAGFPPPPAMSSLVRMPDGQFRFNIACDAQGLLEVQGSTDLIDWVPLQTCTNTISPIQFTDPAANFPQRFYRVKQSQ